MRQYKLSSAQDGMHSAEKGQWTWESDMHYRPIPMTKTLILLSGLLLSSALHAEDSVLTTFTKQHLTPQFMSEGATYGDFNRDGVQDVTSGAYWYAGPSFTEKKAIYPAKVYDPHNYSNNFIAYARDMNNDKFDDVIVFGFPGKEVVWFQNSHNDAMWKRHEILNIADNESPMFCDVTGDGKPEIVCTRDGFVGYATADWSDPSKPWTWHSVSAKGGWHKFTHGIGVGDINSDGKIDIILREGWWEQPASIANDKEWVFHKAGFGSGGAQMLVYDVDGDGRNDIITSLSAHGWGLAWFQQQSDGSFKQHGIIGQNEKDSPYGVKFSQMHALELADMDGDGLQDVVTGKRYWAHGEKGDPEPNAPAVLYWFRLTRTDAGPHYVPMQIDDNSGVGTQVTVGDLNKDKRPDVVVANKKGTFVFINVAKPVSKAEWEAAQPKKTN